MGFTQIKSFETGIGWVTVYELDNGHIEVKIRPNDMRRLRRNVIEDGADLVLEVWEGVKAPKPGDEIHINGKTVGVEKVMSDQDGTVSVLADNGERIKIEE